MLIRIEKPCQYTRALSNTMVTMSHEIQNGFEMETNKRSNAVISEFSIGSVNRGFYCVIRYTNNRTIKRTKLSKILENISCFLYTVFTYGFLYNVFIYKRLGQLRPLLLVNEFDLCYGSRVMCIKFELNWSRIAAVIVSTDKHPISSRYK